MQDKVITSFYNIIGVLKVKKIHYHNQQWRFMAVQRAGIPSKSRKKILWVCLKVFFSEARYQLGGNNFCDKSFIFYYFATCQRNMRNRVDHMLKFPRSNTRNHMLSEKSRWVSLVFLMNKFLFLEKFRKVMNSLHRK